MNINTILVKFASQELILAKSSYEREKINISLSTLESKIKYCLSYEVNKFVRFGSYTRNTILPRRHDSKSDVDLMVVFNVRNNMLYTTGTYRTKIHNLLAKSYPNSFSSKDFPVVKLELNHIMFDLVPAYTTVNSWSGIERYYIPDKSNGWRETFPNDINQTLSNKNQDHGNNVVRNVIRLCKHWNSAAGYPLESYLMEKKILAQWHWGNEDTYEMFLKTMRYIAGNRPSVNQALEQIEYYKGNWLRDSNEAKQLQWLRKLLPNL